MFSDCTPDDFQESGAKKKNGKGILSDLRVEGIEELVDDVEGVAEVAGSE